MTGASPDAFLKSAVPVMRRMIELGFMIPR
jgi:hypothetical protein